MNAAKLSGERWFDSVIRPELDRHPTFAATLREAAPRLAKFATFLESTSPETIERAVVAGIAKAKADS